MFNDSRSSKENADNEKRAQTNGDQAASAKSTNSQESYVVSVLNELPKHKFAQINDSDRFYEQLLAHAIKWGIDDEIALALTALEGLRGDVRKYGRVATLLQKLLCKQQSNLGESHVALARTEMLLGICLQKTRDTDAAVRSLRSAVTRFQQCDEGVDRDIFVECLCALSSCYRDTGHFDASRTCIKQAYRLLPEHDAPLRLQCAALEELAADLLGEHRFKLALEGYARVVAMKTEVLKTEVSDIVRSLIQLGMCHFALHQLDEAELCVIQAGEMYHKLQYDDTELLVQILDSLTGILRHKAQFMQADFLEEIALELKGRSQQMGGHMLYGNLLEEARLAEEQGDNQTAKVKYREALCQLESQRSKRAVDRLQILANLLLLTGKQQLVQRSSLHSDIEDSVRAIFCGLPISTADGVSRMGLLNELCGKQKQANTLKRLAEELGKQPSQVSQTEARITETNTARPQIEQINGTIESRSPETIMLEAKVYDAEDVEEI